MSTKIKTPKSTSQIRVSRENAKRIKSAAVNLDTDMEQMANTVIEAGFKAMKIK